jgi:hypothetical protein
MKPAPGAKPSNNMGQPQQESSGHKANKSPATMTASEIPKTKRGPGPADAGEPYSPPQSIEQMDCTESDKSNKKPPALTLQERAVQAIAKEAASHAGLKAEKAATTEPKTGSDDPTERAKQFISKAKEKMVADIKTRLGKELLTYEAVHNGNRRSTMASNILGENIVQSPELKGWVELADSWFLSGGLNMALNAWKIISTSFDMDWTCLSCGQHGSRPTFKIHGEADSSCSTQVVVLSDQSFPEVLPANSNKNCIKILLIENGSLEDLVSEFIRMIGNRRVPPGTTILLFSASHLGAVGTAAYTEDLLEAEKRLKD